MTQHSTAPRWKKSSYSGNQGGACVETAAPVWTKSSYSGNQGGDCVETAAPMWAKSSYSGNQGGQCVEAAVSEPAVGVRDSKDLTKGHLAIPTSSWSSLTSALKDV